MTLIVVLILGAGAILIASAFDGTPIAETFQKLYTGQQMRLDFGAGLQDSGAAMAEDVCNQQSPHYDPKKCAQLFQGSSAGLAPGLVRSLPVQDITNMPLTSIGENLQSTGDNPYTYLNLTGMAFDRQMRAVRQASAQGSPVLLGITQSAMLRDTQTGELTHPGGTVHTLLVRRADASGLWAWDSFGDGTGHGKMRHFLYADVARAQPYGAIIPE